MKPIIMTDMKNILYCFLSILRSSQVISRKARSRTTVEVNANTTCNSAFTGYISGWYGVVADNNKSTQETTTRILSTFL